MKHILILTISLLFLQVTAQENRQYDKYMHPNDSLLMVSLPELKLPESYKGLKAKDLPDFHNNAENEFFRPIFDQYGWSCGQASTIGYNFTYEMNRFKNTSAQVEENQYAPGHTFNFFNLGENGIGMCYLYTLDAIKWNGNPNVTDYGGMYWDLSHWANGYDIYYNGMFNKIDEIYSIHVGDEEGLLTLKQYMYDHLDGSATGGIANFYTDLYSFTSLPAGTPEEGKSVITEFGPYTGHSMTFIGWNDSIRWDYNNDGQYTNDIDINNDGEVTMKDWEIGGVILANSWGDSWADDGFCYVMYNVLAREKMDGGIWNKMVNVITLKENYEPRLTYKVTLTHDSRNKIKVVAGVSADTNSALPQHVLEFPIFNYQGGDFYMQGDNSNNANKTLEFGLDVTPLLSYVNPGEAARFFLKVYENDPFQEYSGSINQFSLMDYTDEIQEIECPDTDVALNDNSITTLSIDHTVNWDDVEITDEDLLPFVSGETYSSQLSASGGMEPYRWEIAPVYADSRHEEDYPEVDDQQLIPTSNQTGFAMKAIDFQFPFYDRFVDTVYMHVDGFLKFDENPYPLPYQVGDELVFKNESVVAAFLNEEIFVNTSSGNKLWYEGNETHATFRWQVTIEVNGSNKDLDVTATLYPDGRIEVYHDTYSFPDQVSRFTGISNGDAINFLQEKPVFVEALSSPMVYAYTPLNYPAEASITPDGILSFLPSDDNKIYSISVRVTDNYNVSDHKQFQLSNGMIYTCGIQSGDDEQIDYGETTFLNFILKNNSDLPLNDIVLSVGSEDPLVNWIDNEVTVGALEAGESVDLEGSISFGLNAIYPDGYNFTVDVLISASEGEWESRMNLTARAPALAVGTPTVDDGDNQRLDPGETADIIIPVMNTGFAMAEEVQVVITTDDPFVTINNETLDLGSIGGGETAYGAVSVSTSEDTPQGHTTPFFLTISASPDLSFTDSFTLLIGRFPVYVADLDPELLSGPYIVEALEQLEILYDYDIVIPNELDFYQNIFVTLGRNFGNHVLTQTEGTKLAGFLENGGNIYMEGALTWWDDPETPVHPMFNLEAEYVGWTQIDSVYGNTGTFLDSLKFGYDGDMIYYNNHLLPLAGAYPVLHPPAENHNFAVAYAGDNYKTIGSILDFGGMVDGPSPSTKYHLLGKILEFFEVEVTIVGAEEHNNLASVQGISCYPNPMKDDLTLMFTLGEQQAVTVRIFDVHGNEVAIPAADKMFPAGKHELQADLADLPAAVYICTITTPTWTNSVRLIKTD